MNSEKAKEIAIDVDIQSKCALVAICKILTTLPTKRDITATHLSKKVIKKIRKQIQKDLSTLLDRRDAEELVAGNFASLKGTVDAIRANKEIVKGKHHLLLSEMSNQLRTSMLVGYNKFYV